MSGVALVVVCALAGTWPSADDDLTATQRLERAALCFEELDLECAEAELIEARRSLQTLAAGDRERVIRLSAEVAFSSERQADAEVHLRALLALNPTFEPAAGAWPGPWRDTLVRLRAAAPDRSPPTLRVQVPVQVETGQAFEVEVLAEDRSGVGGVTLLVFGATTTRIALTTTDGRTWRGTVAASLVVGDAVPIQIEATDQLGNGPASWGAPHRVPVLSRPEPAPSVVETWWFWTAIGGAVAVAVATGITVWALPREDEAAIEITPPETGSVYVELPPWFVE